METPAPAKSPTAEAQRLPWELITIIGGNLLETGQHASFASLLGCCKKGREVLKLLAKRFAVLRGDSVSDLDGVAGKPGAEQMQHVLFPEREPSHATAAQNWPSLQPQRADGSQALKSVGYWQQVEMANGRTAWKLCTDVSMTACFPTAANLFDLDQAVNLVNRLAFGQAARSHVPIHIGFMEPDGEIPAFVDVQELSVPTFSLLSSFWALHLGHDLVEHDEGYRWAQNMIVLLLGALSHRCDSLKGFSQWNAQTRRPVLTALDMWSLNAAQRMLKAMGQAYNLEARSALVDVHLKVELEADFELPSKDDVFKVFHIVRKALAGAVDKLDLWKGRLDQCDPQIKLEVRVEGETDDWIEATLGVERLSCTQRLRHPERVHQHAIVTKYYLWHINGERRYGDDPSPVEDRFVYEG